MRKPSCHMLVVVLLILLLAFTLNGLVSFAQQSQTVVLRGATLIDGLGGAPIPQAVVVIEGEQIRSVGGATTNYPSGATVIDLSGKFIIPGLMNSHSHYEEWMGEVFLNHGVTSVVGVGGRFGDKKAASHSSAARTPRLYDTAGDPRLSPSLTQAQVRDAIQQWLKGKPDFARLRPLANDHVSQVYQWAAEEIHRAGLMVFGHTENASESIRAGQDSVEHLWGFAQAQMSPQELDALQRGHHLHWAPFFRDWTRLDQMIREAVDRGVYVNPTLLHDVVALSPHAVKYELEAYRLYSDPRLMTYFPKNIADSLLQRYRQIRSFSGKL